MIIPDSKRGNYISGSILPQVNSNEMVRAISIFDAADWGNH